jgi:dolichol-phosphate mannosyltransferase
MRGPDGPDLVCFVDDGSTDDTYAVLTRVASDKPGFHVVSQERNRGYGSALREGARYVQALGCSHAVFMDSDLTNPPSELPAFVDQIRAGAQYVKASRFATGGNMEGVPAWRAALSGVANRVARRMYGTSVLDVTNGFRAVSLELYESWNLREEGFAIIMEEMHLAVGQDVQVKEVPSVLGCRREEVRPTSFRINLYLIVEYLRYPLQTMLQRWHRGIRPPRSP